MANKIGFFEKFKIYWYWFTNPSQKHVLIVSCEFCNSTNVIAKN